MHDNHIYRPEQLWFPLSEDILGWDIDFHQLMLGDQLRMTAYEKAIKEVVQPGMIVLDLGTGTGILAQWALEAGAAKVYGIDVNQEILAQARKTLDDHFIALPGLSYDIDLPEKVDLIISEILGNLADNEDMTPILADARKRFLKEGGLMLPSRVRSYLVPVSSPRLHKQVHRKVYRSVNGSYNLDELLAKLNLFSPFDLYYDAIFPDRCRLSQPKQLREFHFAGGDSMTYEVVLEYRITQTGLFTGFKGCFIAQLSPQVKLDISGDNILGRTTSDCWKHCYLPVTKLFEVQIGDLLKMTFERAYPTRRDSPLRQVYGWRGKISRNNKVVYRFDQRTGS